MLRQTVPLYLFFSISILFSKNSIQETNLTVLNDTAFANKTPLNVLLLFVSNNSFLENILGYHSTAGAALAARDLIESQGLLKDYYFNFSFAIDNCVLNVVAGESLKALKINNVKAVVGPVCSAAAEVAGVMTSFYDKALVTWGMTTANTLNDFDRFPTLLNMAVNSFSLGIAIRRILYEYKISEFAYIYSNAQDADKCENIKADLQLAVSMLTGVTISYTMEILNTTPLGFGEAIKNASQRARNRSDVVITHIAELLDLSRNTIERTLTEARTRARIFVLCFAEGYGYKRDFMLAALDSGYVNDEYLYIFADTKSRGYAITGVDGTERYTWQLDGDPRNEDALKAFRKTLAISDSLMTDEAMQSYLEWGHSVIGRIKEPPFNCGQECDNPGNISTYAGQFHDGLIFLARIFNNSLTENPDKDPMEVFDEGALLFKNIETDFEGVSGRIQFNRNGSRMITFFMLAISEQGTPETYASIFVDGLNANFTPYYKSVSEVFNNRANKQPPLTVPVCGFTGQKCPVDFVATYLIWIILAALILCLAIGAVLSGIAFSIHGKKKEMERLNKMWQIPYSHLQDVQKKNKGEHSTRSFSSGPSNTGTKITLDTKIETRHFKFYTLNNEKIAAMKHTLKLRPDANDAAELRQLRNVEHDNLNIFYGLCSDGPEMYSIWKFCSRGSLADVISKGSITMDFFFVYSLLRDIVSGLAYIHKSFIMYHGHLTSKMCVVDERFQVKISYFGLRNLRHADTMSNEDMLWTAPEILKNPHELGSEKGDIYSFAIICSELVTKRPAWDLENRKEPAETLIYWLKRDRGTPPRPELTVHESLEINSGLLELIRDCWAQDPDRRPGADQIRSLLRGLHSGRNDNLMDHVFNIMEQYAATLEEEVSSRTKELAEEKKKSDLLLYRMLPRQVAEKLKLGQVVQPETFDSVTVFFSDVVQFTILASKCTPLQVVTLLNDLYNVLDNIIEEHDVYKVETIGDGYLCVSGLPHRNGNDHSRQIASLSLSFMEGVRAFRIPHMPSERLNLRIGVHCGSVVAGVVGLTMPRYCLFGDTVNTASRMESNGKAGYIHLSSEANHFLTTVVGGYHTESRGEVIIKGKGVMETFWLISKIENGQEPPLQSIIKERKISTPTTEEAREPSIEQRSVTPPFSRAVSPVGIYSDYKKNYMINNNNINMEIL